MLQAFEDDVIGCMGDSNETVYSMQAAFLLKAINVCSIGVLNGAKAQSSSQFFMIIKPDNVGFEQTMQENMYTKKSRPCFVFHGLVCTKEVLCIQCCFLFCSHHKRMFFSFNTVRCQVTGTTSILDARYFTNNSTCKSLYQLMCRFLWGVMVCGVCYPNS